MIPFWLVVNGYLPVCFTLNPGDGVFLGYASDSRSVVPFGPSTFMAGSWIEIPYAVSVFPYTATPATQLVSIWLLAFNSPDGWAKMVMVRVTSFAGSVYACEYDAGYKANTQPLTTSLVNSLWSSKTAQPLTIGAAIQLYGISPFVYYGVIGDNTSFLIYSDTMFSNYL